MEKCRSSHRRCSIKKLILKTLHYSQENACAMDCVKVSFQFRILQNLQEHLFWKTPANDCFWKCVHETENNRKLFIGNFNFTIKKRDFSTSISETSENFCFYFIIDFVWTLYSHAIFPWCGEKWTQIQTVNIYWS